MQYSALQIASDLGSELAAIDPSTLEAYGRDWTRVYAPAPIAVLFPRDTAEVAHCLQYCQARELPVVPSGGRTGLAGGAMACSGEVVLSCTRLQKIGAVETMGATLEVGAGVTTEAVHRQCHPLGLIWPVDLASKGSSTIGGNLATNAGGIRVVRYGHTRQWVTGLVAVLMSGEVLHLKGALHKDNCGPDLCQLLIGSEGILAVITEATLKLTRAPGASWVVLFRVEGPTAALRLLASARKFGILAFEYLADPCLEAVLQVRQTAAPFAERSPGYVLMEVELSDQTEATEQWLSSILEDGLAADAVLGQTSSDKARLWAYRENITESLGHLGLMHKNDIAVPVSQFGNFIEQLERDIAPDYPGKLYLFGHLGDGNLHLNVMKPVDVDPDRFWERCRAADQRVYQLLQQFGGSVSAEHGIGLLKKSALRYSRSAGEIALLRSIKQTFDPRGLLNPGKVLDYGSS